MVERWFEEPEAGSSKLPLGTMGRLNTSEFTAL